MAQTQAVGSNTTTDATAGAATPAVSARILKKRETDRRCQRMIRERTKSRIAYLEGLVEQFRQQDASGRVETLMQQLQEVKEERDTLAKQVKNIESIVSSTKLKEEPDTRDTTLVRLRSNESTRPPNVSISPQPAYHHSSPSVDDLASASPPDPGYAIHNKEYQAYMESSSRSSWAASTLQPPHSQSCECSSHYSALDPGRALNKWRYANDTLTEWFKWSPQALDMSKYAAFNDDVPVRAIVEGWDAVEKYGHMHPAWRLLRGIDQNIFSTCDARERLAILQVMGLLLQAHINPTTEQHRKLPPFYIKRPSQDMLHSYATEYFARPGLRERFIFSEHRYCSNIFWRLFCKSLRLQWPFEFRDCYTRNTDTGLYRISPTFHERINDIRCWTMGMEMFKQYPELYGDIPAWNHIPASMAALDPRPRPARRALPPTATATNLEQSGDGTELDSDHSQHPHSIATPTHSHQPHSGQIAVQYPHSPTNATFGATPPMSTFDFSANGVVTTMADMQNITSVQHWVYGGGVEMFQMNPA